MTGKLSMLIIAIMMLSRCRPSLSRQIQLTVLQSPIAAALAACRAT